MWPPLEGRWLERPPLSRGKHMQVQETEVQFAKSQVERFKLKNSQHEAHEQKQPAAGGGVVERSNGLQFNPK